MASGERAGQPETGRPQRAWLADLAWSPALGLRTDVLLEAAGGRLIAVTPDAEQVPAAATRLA